MQDGEPHWQVVLDNYKKQILFALIGGVLISGAILASKVPQAQPDPVELSSNLATSSAELMVEIAGAINKPGVYKLPINSRIDDLISAGGGLSSDADQEYVSKTINRAGVIKDGQKIYIPEINEVVQQTDVLSASDNPPSGGTININTASKSQLESLWGIGPVIAQNIIDQRPYSEISELLSRSIVKSNVYERIKEQISIY